MVEEIVETYAAMRSRDVSLPVMAGLVPAIHVLL